MEIIERITETLEKTDKKATDLCDRLGIRTSTMSTWKTRNSDPPAKYIKPIADFLGVSVHYLLTGEEAPARKLTTAEEDELLELYRALPQNKQFEFIGELKGFLKAYTLSWHAMRRGPGTMPLHCFFISPLFVTAAITAPGTAPTVS